jgi:hypothetical protein
MLDGNILGKMMDINASDNDEEFIVYEDL